VSERLEPTVSRGTADRYYRAPLPKNNRISAASSIAVTTTDDKKMAVLPCRGASMARLTIKVTDDP